MNKKFVTDDSLNDLKLIVENEDSIIKEIRYRNLQKKSYVYDSLDDEEIIEDLHIHYIRPDSFYVILLDFLVCICSFINLIYIPYFLGSNNIYCNHSIFSWDNLFEYFIDIIYVCDIILPFFVAFYNFDEVLTTDLNSISRKYLEEWFIYDLIAVLPIKNILSFFDNKCKNEVFLISPLYHRNFYYI
jgi:hypothetical protein